ncbi:MAG: hypothetical protein WD200_04515 [Candidatus Andersenbacteria bacterium]
MPRTYTIRSFFVPTVAIAFLALGGCARNVSPAPPGGIYRSTSAGANFDQAVAIVGKPGEYIARFSLFDIFRVPADPQLVYVAAGGQGIVKSEDGGESWTVISTPLTRALDVVVLDDKTVVVAGSDQEGQGHVIRSLDDGASWQQVFTVPVPTDNRPNFLLGSDPTPSVVVSIQLDPFDLNRIYAASNLGTIFAGEQSAKTWRSLYTVRSSRQTPVGNQRATGLRRLIVSPHRPGELAIVTANQELIRIRDGVQENIDIPQFINDPSPLGRVSGKKDVFDAAFIPQFPDALLVGVEDGAVVTRDSGQSWIQLSVPVELTQKFNIIRVTTSPSNADRLFVAVNNVLYRSEDGGGTWNTFSFGLNNSIISELSINPGNASHMLVVLQQLNT